jgi:hypothetical protein
MKKEMSADEINKPDSTDMTLKEKEFVKFPDLIYCIVGISQWSGETD